MGDPGGIPGFADGGQKDRDQQSDDGDNHQQLDDCEAMLPSLHVQVLVLSRAFGRSTERIEGDDKVTEVRMQAVVPLMRTLAGEMPQDH